jgi:hypothetical protein
VTGFWRNVRLSTRRLAKDRLFTVSAVLALAVGMSATVTMFTVVYGVYLRELPFRDPDRIVTIGTRSLTAAPDESLGLSLPDLQDLRATAQLFDGIAAADEDVTIR